MRRSYLYQCIVGATLAAVTLVAPTVAHADIAPIFDAAYGTDGVAEFTMPLRSSDSSVVDLVTASDGDTLALFSVDAQSFFGKTVIGKLSPSGVPNSAWGTGGYTAPIGIMGASFALQTQGRVLVAGYQIVSNTTTLVVYRYLANGQIDTTFGTSGKFSLQSFPGKNFSYGGIQLAVNSTTGVIYLGTNIDNGLGSNNNFYFLSLNSNGSIRNEWGWSGGREIANTTAGVSAFTELFGMTLLSDDSLLTVGTEYISGKGRVIKIVKINSNGYLDYSFNGDQAGHGIVHEQFATLDNALMSSIEVLSDGSFVVVGKAGSYSTGDGNYAAAKFDADGNIDTTFGTNGFFDSGTLFSNDQPFVRQVGRTQSGEFVIPASTSTGNSGYMKFNSNGQVTSCGSVCYWSQGTVRAMAVTVQADGKILVAGQRITGGNALGQENSAIIKYSSGSTVDATYAGGVLVKSFALQAWSFGIDKSIPQADGSVISFGNASFGEGFYEVATAPLAMKTTPAGHLDTNFGTGGFSVLLNNPTRRYSKDITQLSDGSFLILGESWDQNSDKAINIWKMLPNGTLDANFGVNGLVEHSTATWNLNPHSIAVRPDGKIVTTLSRWNMTGEFAWVYQFQSNGSYISAFAIDPGPQSQFVYNPGADGTGNYYRIISISSTALLVVGLSNVGPSVWNTFIAKYKFDGTLDSSFGSGGLVEFPPSTIEWVNAVHVDTGGKIIFLGETNTPTNATVMIRLLSTGTVDTSFGTNGVLNFSLMDKSNLEYAYESDFAITSSGYLLVGEMNATVNVYAPRSYLAKISLGGLLDNSFGTNGLVWVFSDRSSSLWNATPLDNSRILISGATTTDGRSSGLMMQIGPNSAPTTTAPTTTTTTTLPTTTTVAPAPTTQSTSDDIKLVVSVTQASILKKLKWTPTKGSVISMAIASSSRKVCRVSKTRVLGVDAGTCRVTVTATLKGKKTTKSLSFKVS